MHFADKLLRGEEEVTKLLAPNGNPFDPHRNEHPDTSVVFGAVSSVFSSEGCCKAVKSEGQKVKAYTPPTFVRAELYEVGYLVFKSTIHYD